MRWFSNYRIRLVLVGFVAAIVFGDGTTKARFTFGEPINFGPVANGPIQDKWQTAISTDGLKLYIQVWEPSIVYR